jgi:hypothetical protein
MSPRGNRAAQGGMIIKQDLAPDRPTIRAVRGEKAADPI